MENIKIIDEDGTYKTDPYDYVRKRLESGEIKHYNRLYAERIIPADEGFTMVRKRTDSTSAVFISNTFEFLTEISSMPHNKKNKAVIEVLYESIYGDQWVVRSDETRPRRVD